MHFIAFISHVWLSVEITQCLQLYILFLSNAFNSGAFVAGFMDTCFWTWSGDRQANRLRGMYLASVLGQDIAYFDTSSTGTGGVLQVRSLWLLGHIFCLS
jgi:hypothetical protein